jgi:ADP-ribose pyrophosphatase YjhB (NUDIX family)
MTDRPRRDPDTPRGAGALGRLHLRAGRLAIAAAARLRRPVTLGVRLVALNDRGEVLLVRHSYLPGLALPGGAVDPGETCREAAAREAAEEAGLELDTPPELFHVYLNRALGNRDHVVLFVARGVRQPHPPARGFEILSSGFHAPHVLPAGTTPATRARLAEVLEGAAPSDDW